MTESVSKKPGGHTGLIVTSSIVGALAVTGGVVEVATGGISAFWHHYRLNKIVELSCELQRQRPRLERIFNESNLESNPEEGVRAAPEALALLNRGLPLVESIAESRIRLSAAILSPAKSAVSSLEKKTARGIAKINDETSGGWFQSAKRPYKRLRDKALIPLNGKFREMLGFLDQMEDPAITVGYSNNPAVDKAIAKKVRDVNCDIHFGDNMPEVAKLQNILTDLGLYRAPVHGRFDNNTEKALQDFLTRKGIQASGKRLDEDVRVILNRSHDEWLAAHPAGVVPPRGKRGKRK